MTTVASPSSSRLTSFARKSPVPAAERFAFRVTAFDSTNLRMVITRCPLSKMKTPVRRPRKRTADDARDDGVFPPTPCRKRPRLDGTQSSGTARTRTSRRSLSSSVVSSSEPWVPSLGLTNRDLFLLETGDWLEDQHVDAAQTLLKRQFPEVNGLQPPCLGQVLQFSPLPRDGKALQIIYNGGCHWVVVSYIDGQVTLYDNEGIGLTPSLQQQIACLCPGTAVNLSSVQQKQRGSSDCGLFVIANCVEIANGKDPAESFFDQHQMRTHLAACLKAERFARFPQRNDVRRS